MDELLTRQLPHSLEAEQATLGSMLIDARCIPDVIEALKPEDFYLQQNRDIFETIYTMFSYSQKLTPSRCWTTCGNGAFLRSIHHRNTFCS